MSSADGEGTLRLFVACDLPEETLRAVRDWQRRALGARVEVRLNHALHLTLAFLGAVPATRVPELTEALSRVPMDRCDVTVEEPLFLPVRGAKRVIALRLGDHGGELVRLQADVARGLASTGLYEAGTRPWLPHVTVARFRRPGHPFSLQNVNIPGFCAVRVVLYSSLLERVGAVHSPIAAFPAS